MKISSIAMLRRPILWALPLAVVPVLASADWTNPDGQSLQPTAKPERVSVISDGKYGAYFVWTSGSGPNSNVYVQRLDAGGQTPAPQGTPWLWGPPLLVSDAPSGRQNNAVAAFDCSGGAFVAWEDGVHASTVGTDIIVQHVNPNGERADDLYAVSALGEQVHPSLAISRNVTVPGGEDGILLVWQDSYNLATDGYKIRGQLALGAAPCSPILMLEWGVTGSFATPLCDQVTFQFRPQVVSDHQGGAIIVWEDVRNGFTDIYVSHLTASGAWDSTWGGLASRCGSNLTPGTLSSDQFRPMIASDGRGGAFVAWIDDRNNNSDVHAGRLQPNGVFTGIKLTSKTGRSANLDIASDGVDGALVVWQYQDPNTGYDIYAQRLDPNGNPLWTSGGVAACAASGAQTNPEVVSNAGQGAWITWMDTRADPTGTSPDIYLNNVSRLGEPATEWSLTAGRLMCAANAPQSRPGVTVTPDGSAVVAWEDLREGSTGLYAEKVATVASVGVFDGDPRGGIEISAGAPNPFRARVRFQIELREMAPIVLEIYDMQGRRVRTLARETLEPGRFSYEWDGTREGGAPTAPGVYVLRARVREVEEHRKLVRLR